jgi:sugar O-acyltransferase (sialic acid O-acetyltransferase NeuD family)
LKEDIAIYGAGGLGRELALMIQQINQVREQWNIVGFFDDGIKPGEKVDSWKVVGGLSEANQWSTPLAMVVAIADPHVRMSLVEKLVSPALMFPTLVHPSCNTGDTKRNYIGKGVILTANVVMTTNVRLDDFVIINLSTTIGHDVTIGSAASIMPGCSISGNVKIGARCLIGTGVRFLQNVSIGEGSIVGAGAVVTKNFEANSKIMGVPARRMIR